MKRILVTGASGFVGRHLTAALVGDGYEVGALIHKCTPAAFSESFVRDRISGPKWIYETDLLNYEGLQRSITSVAPDGVIHCAAQAAIGASWKSPADTFNTNIVGTANLLEALRPWNPRIVLVGSAQQYRRPDFGRALLETDPLFASSPYALSKIAQEELGRLFFNHYGMQIVFTRSFNHTGPGQSSTYAVGSFISKIAGLSQTASREMTVGNLDAKRDFLDVRDVASAYLALLLEGRPGDAYNVCSGRAHKMGDLLTSLLEMAKTGSAIQINQRESDPTDTLLGDPTKITQEVGWKPQIPLTQSLGEALAWQQRQPRTELA